MASDPGTGVPSRPLIFSLSHARDMLITSFHISYNYNYYNYNYLLCAIPVGATAEGRDLRLISLKINWYDRAGDYCYKER